MVRAWH